MSSKNPLGEEAVAVELSPRAIMYFPYPHRVTHVLLQNYVNSNQSMSETFRKGVSYATIYELKNKNSPITRILTKKDVSRLEEQTYSTGRNQRCRTNTGQPSPKDSVWLRVLISVHFRHPASEDNLVERQ